jgi:glycosyltransferase involved in cell wall biosynthesis
MQRHNPNAIALDLIVISENYQGGASIFARTFLNEITTNPTENYVVILPEKNRIHYANLEKSSSKVSFFYFKSRDNIFIRIIYRLATQIIPNSTMLSMIQRYRWSEAIRYIQNNSVACLTLSTYINFPLKGLRHFCTLHDIQDRSLPDFFTKSEKSLRKTHTVNTLKNVTGIQVSSTFIQNEIIKFYPKYAKLIQFRVIPEGFSSKELLNTPRKTDQREKPIKIIFPANYWPHKSHFTLFKAISYLNRDYKIVVNCTGYTFGKERELSLIVEKLKLDNINFLGHIARDELIKLYRKSHIVISCSMYESSSLPILEGSVLGCIPIASDIPSHREMSERLDIKLFKLRNPQDLYRVLMETFKKINSNDFSTQDFNSKAVMEHSWPMIIPKYIEALKP